MLDETAILPEDPEELRAFTARLLAELRTQAVLIEKLRHQLAGHRAHRFGTSSETAEQLQLALETSEIAAAAMTARMRLPDIEEKGCPKRRPIPDHIPRMEVELTPGADACADCGGRLRRIGADTTEELEYVPGRFIVNRIVRPALRLRVARERFVQALLPSRPIERGRPGPGLLAHVLVNKYADHLPVYRRSQIFERDGLDLDRSTLTDWVGKGDGIAGAAGRCRGPPRAGGRGDLRRRHPGAHANARHRQDPDRQALGQCPGRAPLGRGSGTGGVVSVLRRPPRPAPEGSSCPLPHLDACRRLRRLRRPLPLGRDPRGRLPGASSSTSIVRRPCRSPRRPLPGSPSSKLSRRRGDRRRLAAPSCGRPMPPRSSTRSRPGWRCS